MAEHSGFGLGGGFMWIIWILLIVAVLWAINMAVGGRRADGAPESLSALEIIEQRYARGEIDEAEFERKRKELGG